MTLELQKLKIVIKNVIKKQASLYLGTIKLVYNSLMKIIML